MLSELRDLLNLLDDPEIEQLCIVDFSKVKAKFSAGMRRDEKINLLLDYCRRYPREGERLRKTLRKPPPSQGVGVLPRPVSGGGNTTIIIGDGNIVGNGNDNVRTVPWGEHGAPPNSNHGGKTMDELLTLAAGLQFAYWFWNATVQPGMTRFSDRIGETLGEITSAKLRRWFGEEPPQDAQGKVDESESAQQQRIVAAQAKVKDDVEWNSDRFMGTTKQVLVQLLREPTKYSMGELQKFWQSFGDLGVPFVVLVAKNTLGDVQAGIANELVMEAICRGTLPQLIAAMRKARP